MPGVSRWNKIAPTPSHVWQVGPGHHAAIVSIRSPTPLGPSAYKAKLALSTGCRT